MANISEHPDIPDTTHLGSPNLCINNYGKQIYGKQIYNQQIRSRFIIPAVIKNIGLCMFMISLIYLIIIISTQNNFQSESIA